jgi:hypothetical protein
MAQPPANSAGPVLRAGFTDVLVTGMLIRWISVSARPIAVPLPAQAETARLRLVPATLRQRVTMNAASRIATTSSATAAGIAPILTIAAARAAWPP